MQQARDYQTEANNLYNILEFLNADDLTTKTQFNRWTIEDVVGHLHLFDTAALASLKGANAFTEFFGPVAQSMADGRSFLQAQQPWLNGLSGVKLVNSWRETSLALGLAFESADPKSRLKWAGPDMSARSSITARQMETWAHGQEVFDSLGIERINGDHIRNICHLGVSTFAWAFLNRGLDVPLTSPFIHLTAPSGVVWEWNADSKGTAVTGSAVEFAQVVTQVRNIADTSLRCEGEGAKMWMAFAQCFAGPPMDPPTVGTRFCVELE